MKTEVGFVTEGQYGTVVTNRMLLRIEPQSTCEATLLAVFARRAGLKLARDGIGSLVIEEPEQPAAVFHVEHGK